MGPSVVPNFEFFWCSILWTMTKQDIYYTRFLAMEAVGMKITSAHAATRRRCSPSTTKGPERPGGVR